MKRTAQRWMTSLITVILLVATLLTPTMSLADEIVDQRAVQLRYTETKKISASLSISSGTAVCTGILTPQGMQSCFLTMKLYKKNGYYWTLLETWTASATGGNSAYLYKTKSVTYGIYKVVCSGNVAGETSSATSNVIDY